MLPTVVTDEGGPEAGQGRASAISQVPNFRHLSSEQERLTWLWGGQGRCLKVIALQDLERRGWEASSAQYQWNLSHRVTPGLGTAASRDADEDEGRDLARC